MSVYVCGNGCKNCVAMSIVHKILFNAHDTHYTPFYKEGNQMQRIKNLPSINEQEIIEVGSCIQCPHDLPLNYRICLGHNSQCKEVEMARALNYIRRLRPLDLNSKSINNTSKVTVLRAR